jgi:hypothetical protein
VIFTASYVWAGVKLCTALPHNDITRDHGLAAKDFNAKPLGLGIASVSSASASFFMRHL